MEQCSLSRYVPGTDIIEAGGVRAYDLANRVR